MSQNWSADTKSPADWAGPNRRGAHQDEAIGRVEIRLRHLVKGVRTRAIDQCQGGSGSLSVAHVSMADRKPELVGLHPNGGLGPFQFLGDFRDPGF